MKKYVLILNDGTDEIFNLNGIEAESLEDFKAQYTKAFGRELNYRTYCEVQSEEYFTMIGDISNADNQTPEERLILDLVQDKFVSWKVFSKAWKDQEQRKGVRWHAVKRFVIQDRG